MANIKNILAKKALTKLAKISGVCILTVGVLLASGLLYLNSEGGRKTLATTLSNTLSSPKSKIEIDDIQGSLFSIFKIPNVTISDPQGAWLEIKNIRINWTPSRLFAKTFHAQDMVAETIIISRSPITTDVESKASSDPLTLPSLPIDIDIERFGVTTILTGTGLVETATDFTFGGALELTRNDGIETHLELTGQNQNSDHVNLDIAYPPDGSDLLAKLDLFAPQNGLITSLTGLELSQNAKITLNGSGPVQNWSGNAIALIGNEEISNWQFNNNEDGFSLTSRSDLSAFLQEELLPLAGSTLQIDLLVSPTNDQSIKDITGNISNSVAVIDLKSSIDFDAENFIGETMVEINTTDVSPINELIAPAFIEPLKLTATLNNTLTDPLIEIDFKDNKVGLKDQLTMTLGGTVIAEVKDHITLSTAGEITNMHGPALATTGDIFKNAIHWNIESTYGQETSQVQSDTIRLSHNDFNISGSARYNIQNGALTARMSSSIPSLSNTLNNLMVGFDANGSANINIEATQINTSSSLETKLSVTTDNISTEIDVLNLILGKNPALTSTLIQQVNGDINFSDLGFEAQLLDLNSSGVLSSEQQFENTSFTISLRNMENLESVVGPAITGDITIDGQISGNATSPDLEISTGFSALDLQGVSLTNFATRAKLTDLANNLKGQITATSDTNFGQLNANISLHREGDSLNIPGINAALGNYSLEGELRLPSSSPVIGSLVITSTENNDNTAVLNGGTNLNISLSDKQSTQHISLQGEITDLAYALDTASGINMERAIIDGNILLADKGPEITLTANISDLNHPNISSSETNIDVRKIDLGTMFVINTTGTDLQPFDLELTGNLLQNEDTQHLTAALNGSIGETPITLSHEGDIIIAENEINIPGFSFVFGEGVITGQAQTSNDAITASIKAENADLKPLISFVPEIPFMGKLNGAATIQGSINAPVSQFDLVISDIVFDARTGIAPKDLSISINGTTDETKIVANGELSFPDEFEARFDAIIPLRLEGEDHLVVSQKGPISGKFLWNGEISSVWPALKMIDHDLSGSLNGDILLSGTLSEPDIDGTLSLSNGRYENMQTGFIANDIDLLASIEDRNFSLDRFSANDGEDGTINAQADVRINRDFSIDTRTTLTLTSAKLVRQPELSIEATTDLLFVKNQNETTLSGAIVVDSANIGAIEQGGPSITTLNVTEINGEGIVDIETTQEDTLGPVDLDLTLAVPGRLFVRSFGLDSEWKADLTVTGTSEAPIITGTAEQIRGFFEFSGKRFELTRGSFSFPGERSNDPIIEIMAEHQLTDMVANLRIYGRASNPSLEMSSTPYLPENEVMARILFGASVADLSAAEAVQLASAIHSLSNGGGQGLMGGIRRAIGVDRLSIDNDASREYGTTITGGKYLTDNVYVEVSTAPATGQTATSVEVGLTRSLSLVTRRTLDHDNNLSIRWSWDY